MDEANRLTSRQQEIGKSIKSIITSIKDAKTRTQKATLVVSLTELWQEALLNNTAIVSLNVPECNYVKQNYFHQMRAKYDEATIGLANLDLAASSVNPLVKKRNNRIRFLEKELVSCETSRTINPEEFQAQYWLDRLRQRLTDLEEAHYQVCDELPDDEIEENSYDELQPRASDYISKLLKLSTPDVSSPPPPPQHHSVLPLPQISISPYEGGFKEWSEFADIFKRLVHDRPYSKSEKMQYLKSSLRGEPLKLISQLAITDDNYDIAWKIVKERYDNQRLLLAQIIDRLLDQPTCTRESAGMLKDLHDTTKECLEVIKNMNIDVTTWDPLIGRIIVRKWDSETNKTYEQGLENPYEIQKLDDLLNFLRKRFQSLELCVKSSSQPTTSGSNSCAICQGSHSVFKCNKFQGMSVHERNQVVKNKKLCTRCLGKHIGKCFSKYKCQACQGFHNTLLHYSKSNNQQQVLTAGSEVGENKLLATAIVNIPTIHGGMYAARVLVDQGSEISMITENAVQQIGLIKKAATVEVIGLGDDTPKISKSKVNVQIYPRFSNNWTLNTELFVLSKLTEQLPSQPLEVNYFKHWESRILADPNFYRPSQIDILLGVGDVTEILLSGLDKHSGYMAQNSELGWLISGGQGKNNTSQSIKVKAHVQKCIKTEDLSRFWELEELNMPPATTVEDEICEEIFKTTTTRGADGRYTVSLPFKELPPKLGESKARAAARLIQLEKRFKKDEALKADYCNFIKEYIDLGHMKPSRNSPSTSDGYYIPHHAVFKANSSTTKLRVVFDASCRTTMNTSLNEKLFIGPQLHNDLTDLLLRWRRHKIVFTADIEKMYRQISVAEEHQKYQKILWRNQPGEAMKEYQLTTVTYGTAAAPYLAIRTLHQLASDETEISSNIFNVIRNDFYVDDLLSGSDNISSAKVLQQKLLEVMEKGGFNLRKWSSNHPDLIKSLPPKQIDQSLYELGADETKKTLGISWDPNEDIFTFQSNISTNKKLTKRIMLSEISKIFDPLGWLAPVVVKTKLQIQQLWMEKIDWDEELSAEHKRQWYNFCTQLPSINSIKITRWLSTTDNLELHGFCDASEKAYGAVVYSKTQLNNVTNINILQAKSKVAPIKTKVTLPRLELCAAVLLAKLLCKVKNSLNVPMESIFAWSDSTISLAWIKGPPAKRETFIANRISEINNNIPHTRWNHVRTHENPADLISRGVDPGKLSTNNLWWCGPSWLKKKITDWPPQPMITTHTPEVTRLCAVSITRCPIDIQRFSTFTRMLRVICYCRRFIKPCIKGPIESLELELTLKAIIKRVQEETFFTELAALSANKQVTNSSNIKSLNPFIDEENIMRIGGRLNNADLTYNQRHPIIIPSGHHLTKLILHDAHKNTLHGGIEATLAYVRRKFWILRAKTSIRAIIRNCTTCIRYRAQASAQLMGQLPKPRVTPSRPFTHTGVDYAGPINVRTSKGRGNKSYKGYIAIFICLATKAIHIEVVSDLTTNTFLAAFKRFTARRGPCQHMYSDNGTTFVGAAKILRREIWDIEMSEEIQGATSKLGTKWHFIPALSPHFGGLWEAGVKSIKFHLKRQLGDSTLTYEEMTTLLCQIEAALNSRPLCFIDNDSNAIDIITAGHFLIGAPIIEPPNPIETDINTSMAERWRVIQAMKKNFWKSWSSEYLSRLQQQYKWNEATDNLQVGAVVIMKIKDINPARWPLAKIIEVHPGEDGKVRVVTLKGTNGNTFKRAIVNLIPLPSGTIAEEEKQIVTDETNQARSATREETRKSPRTRKFNVLFGIAFLCSLLTTVAAQFSIHNVSSGVYVEHLGSAYINRGRFKMGIIFNKNKIRMDIAAAQDIEKHFDHLCSIANAHNRTFDCTPLKHHLKAQTKKLNWVNHDLGQIKRTSRKRRGLLGTMLTAVFGVNDEVYKDINSLSDNQKELIKTSHRQSKVMLSTLCTLNDTQHKLDTQLQVYREQISNAMKEARSTSFYAHMMNMYQQGLNVIDEVVDHYAKITKIGLNRGSFFELVSPGQVATAVKEALNGLGNDKKILCQKLLETGVSQNETHLEINGYFPISDTMEYTLFKLTGTPINITQATYTTYEMSNNLAAVNYNKQQMFELSPDDFKNCIRLEEHKFGCSPAAIRKLGSSNNCIIEAIYNNAEPCQHRIHTYRLDHIVWKQLLLPNTWMFITRQPITIAIVCQAERTNVLLAGSGILKLNSDCRIDSKEHILLTNQATTIDVLGTYMHPVSLAWKNNTEAVEPARKENIYGPSHSFESIIKTEVSIGQNQEDATWKTISDHHSNIWGMIILVISTILITTGVVIFINKRRQRNHKSCAPTEIPLEAL